MINDFLIIPVVRERIKVKLAPAIPTDAPTTLAEEIIHTPLLLHLKQLKCCPCNQKQQRIYFIFYCMFFFG